MSKHTASVESVLDERTESCESVSEEKQAIFDALWEAKEQLGRSPTVRKYRDMDISPSVWQIEKVFGTWNEAKEAAGLETNVKQPMYDIDEEFFDKRECADVAYWLGTLFAFSSVQSYNNRRLLQVSRVEEKAFFVRGFIDAIECDYPLRKLSPDEGASDSRRVAVQISNQSFITTLVEVGYPDGNESVAVFPEFESQMARWSFVRGFLESGGGFSSGKWAIGVDSEAKAEFLVDVFEACGAKRPTISTAGYTAATVNVANVFDIRAVFESLWGGEMDCAPCWEPYPQKVLSYLNDDYPYPENVWYLSE